MIVWLAALAACLGPEETTTGVTIVYGSRGQGEIEPCGCPERPMGGLARRNGALANKRSEGPVVVVDAGATLGPSAADFDPKFLDQRRAKADLIASALSRGGLDGMALAAEDWALGTPFVRALVDRHRLPVLAANLTCDGAPLFPSGKVVEVAGRTVGLIGLTEGPVEGCVVSEPLAAVQAAVEQLGPVDVLVGLVPYASDRSMAGNLHGTLPLDIVVDARGRAPAAGAERRGATWYVGAGTEMHLLAWMTLRFVPSGVGWVTDGYADRLAKELDAVERRLVRLDQEIAGAGTPEDAAILTRQAEAYRGQAAMLRQQAQEVALGTPRHQLALASRDLDDTVPSDPEIAEEIRRGKAAMEAAAGGAGLRAFVPRVVTEVSSPWLGVEGCVGCHAPQHAQWSTTRHVRAWQALQESERSMDQDCWSCHVTAAREPGGPATPSAAAGFHDVQCEACHGAGRAHAANPTQAHLVASPGREVCVRCHDGKRDGGRFDWDLYRARVAH